MTEKRSKKYQMMGRYIEIKRYEHRKIISQYKIKNLFDSTPFVYILKYSQNQIPRANLVELCSVFVS